MFNYLVLIKDIVDIVYGPFSKNFAKSKKFLMNSIDGNKGSFELSISLVTTRKTLDLQATNEKDVNLLQIIFILIFRNLLGKNVDICFASDYDSDKILL